jgi:hypothetical protein
MYFIESPLLQKMTDQSGEGGFYHLGYTFGAGLEAL